MGMHFHETVRPAGDKPRLRSKNAAGDKPRLYFWRASVVFWRASVVAAVVAGASCTVEPSASGRPCVNDGECGAGHYCQLEIEPNVCVPGALGLPSLPNFPPLIERAIVIVPLGLPGSATTPHSGQFRARDPEGQDPDTIQFVIDDEDSVGPLGSLEVTEDGAWIFTVADPPPASDALASHRLQAIDAQGNVGTANALVVVVTQPPSEFLSYWVGSASASAAPGTSISDAASWDPDGVPDADQSVAIGPGAEGALDIDVDSEVFGWLSTADVPITMGDGNGNGTTVSVRGTRILSDSELTDGRFVAAPVGNFDFEVQLGGLLPSLELQGPARAIGPVHVAGDLALSDGGGVVRLEADLSVDGVVTQSAPGPALLMQGGALRAAGGLVLTGEAKSVITAGLLDVGGTLDAPGATFGGPDLLVRFSGTALAADNPGPVATVRLPEGARIGNAHVAKDAAVVFTTALVVDGTLQLSGGVRVEAPVVVETLVLRPSFVDLGASAAGRLTARTCFVAPFVARPAWLTCDDEDIVPPLDRPDGGPNVEPPPDPGPPSVCTHANADVVTPGGIVGIASDNMEHGLVVVNAGGDPVSDRFVFDGLRLVPLINSGVRGGAFRIDEDGAFTFTPNSVPGVEGLDIAMDVGALDDDGNPLVAGTQEACVDVHIVDTTGMNVMIGFSWDDPAAWTFGRIPLALDRVFIPASPRARVAADVGDDLVARELYVSSGAVLYTGARTLRVADAVLVGGTLDAPVVIGPPTLETSAVGGRISSSGVGPSSAALVCGGGKARLAADVDTATLRSEQPCNFVIGQNRFTAREAVALEHALGLRMNDDFGAVIFESDIRAPSLGGIDSFLNHGELQFRGLIDIDAWLTPASPSHHTFIVAQGDIVIDAIDYDGELTVNADSEGSLTIANGGHINHLFALRDVRLGAELFVDSLVMSEQFTTTTDPALFRVADCVPRPQHPACANPP